MPVLSRIDELAEVYLALLANVATFLVTFALVSGMGRYLIVPLVRLGMDVRGTERTLREGIERIAWVGVIAAAVVIGLSIAGLDFLFDRAAILVAALTVALGFAAQNVIGNLVSGAFIVSDPTFTIGDWIRWDDQEGVIEDITFRSTRVRTFDNEVVSVPNSALTSSAVTNAVYNKMLRLEVPIEVNYDDDLDAVTRVLTEAAADHPEVLTEPEPAVRITELGESVRLVALLWIADPDRIAYGRVYSEYARSVVDRLEAAGIDLGRANPQALEGDVGVVTGTAGAGASPSGEDAESGAADADSGGADA